MKTKIAVKIAIAVTCTIAFMMGFLIKLNQFRIQSNRYSNGSIISPPFHLYYITLSVKNQLYFSAQDYWYNSVCAKRNIVYGEAVTSLGASPLHLRQSLNLVHLCRLSRQWCSRYARNDVDLRSNDVVPAAQMKKSKSFDLDFLTGTAGLEPAECRSQSPVPYRLGYVPTVTAPLYHDYMILSRKKCI